MFKGFARQRTLKLCDNNVTVQSFQTIAKTYTDECQSKNHENQIQVSLFHFSKDQILTFNPPPPATDTSTLTTRMEKYRSV